MGWLKVISLLSFIATKDGIIYLGEQEVTRGELEIANALF